MLTSTQILDIVLPKIETLKQSEAKKKPLEFNDVYKKSVKFYERIRVHSEIGKFPKDLFKKRAPNQTDEEFDYLEATYKTTTMPIWEKYLGSISGIWNPQNWSITFPETPIGYGEDTPEKYLTKEYPCYGSLENYFKNVVLYTKEKDANGLLCIKPHELPLIEDKENEGMYIINDAERIYPVATIYNSPQIWEYKNDEYALILLKDKSWVDYGNGKEQTGLVFELYDTTAIYRVTQVGRKIDYKFEVALYYEHNLGYLPAWKLKGRPIEEEYDILYQAPFMSAIEIMDDILLDDSYLRIIKAGHAFPHKWELVDECDFNNGYGTCVNGKIFNYEGKETDCPNCHGTGKAKGSSPSGVYQVQIPKGLANSPDSIVTPPFGWVAPDPKTMEFLRQEITDNTSRAMSLLNLSSDSSVKGNDTALGMGINRQERYNFIQPISDQNFELFDNSLKAITQMGWGIDADVPSTVHPKNFGVKSEVELTAEIASAKEQNMPDIAIRNLLVEYLNTRFQTSDYTTKAVNLTFFADRLVSLTSQEIATKKSSGAIANWEDILHTSIYNFMEEAFANDETFFEKPILEQASIVVNMAKAKDAEISPKKLDPNQIITNGINANR